MSKKSKGPNPMVFVGMGFEILALGAASVYMGPILDKHFGWHDKGMGVLLFVLFFGWLVHFIHLANKYSEAESAAEHQEKNVDEGNP